MQTSAGIDGEETERTGRSWHVLLAAAEVATAARKRAAIPQYLWRFRTSVTACLRARLGNLRARFGNGIGNDYNRRRMVSRRDFGKMALSGIPLSAAWSAA